MINDNDRYILVNSSYTWIQQLEIYINVMLPDILLLIIWQTATQLYYSLSQKLLCKGQQNMKGWHRK